MKVTQEKLPASQVGLEIEVTAEMSKEAYEKILREFTRNANVDGFRKGKVPRQVLIQRFGSVRLKAAALEELIDDSFKKAIEQEKVNVLGNFQLKSPFEELVAAFEPGSPLTFSATADVPPEATLSDYQGLAFKAEAVEYDPGKVDETLESYRSRKSTLVPVEDRPAQAGDVAVVDFAGVVTEGEETREIPGGSAEDFEIELSEGRFIPGFVDGIIGMTIGETKEVSAQFPDEYAQKDLEGKPAVFTVTLKELKEKELPELDDDFAQDISEFETIAALRQELDDRFRKEVEDKNRANKEAALLNELAKLIQVELPETLVKQEIDYMLTQTAMQFSRQGMDVKRLFTPEIVAQLRERSRPEAIERIHRTLALGEVAKKESIKADPAVVEERIQEFLKDDNSGDIDQARLREVVEEDVLREAIVDWLLERSTVELVPEGSLAPAPDEEDAEEAPAAESLDAPAEAAVDEPGTVTVAAEVVAPEAAPGAAAPADTDESSADETTGKAKKTTKASAKTAEKAADKPADGSTAKRKTKSTKTADAKKDDSSEKSDEKSDAAADE